MLDSHISAQLLFCSTCNFTFQIVKLFYNDIDKGIPSVVKEDLDLLTYAIFKDVIFRGLFSDPMNKLFCCVL